MTKETDLSLYTTSPEYKPGASALKMALWFIMSSLFLRNSLSVFSNIKVIVLRIFGAKIGRGVVIKPNVNIKYPWKLIIDDYTWIGENVWIDNLDHVKIGKHVCISQGALLLTGNHNYKKSTFDLITGKIVLENGVWIGAKSIVCPGVTCKNHSVLSVNSVANQNLQSMGIYQGNPAILIRKREIS